MNDWDSFLQTTKKLVRKNRKLLFFKKYTGVFIDDIREEIDQDRVTNPKVESFSKNEKKRFMVQSTLDLHGYTSEQAYHQLLLDFMNEKKRCGVRDLLIITGGSERDSKTIRTMFLKMVDNELSHLIAKITRAPNNTGAFYVKLRKNL